MGSPVARRSREREEGSGEPDLPPQQTVSKLTEAEVIRATGRATKSSGLLLKEGWEFKGGRVSLSP